MLRLPACFAAVILCFAPLFRQHTWRHAQVLLIGAILVPGQRTVTSILRVSGLCWERRFVNYHRVLNRAAWSGRAAARVLLGLLLDAFAPKGPVLLGLDDHIERRRGKCISAKGIYRDPVRSSKGHFTQGQRPALAQPDAAGPDPLGRAGLGTTLPDRARPLGALQPRAGPAAQEADGLGAAVGPAGPSLDAGANARARGRQQFCRSRTPRQLGPAGRDLRHPPAARRRALRPSGSAPAQNQGTAPHQGRAPADPGPVLANQATPWQRVTVPDWYGEGERVLEICSDTAVWRHNGLPVVPVRWVLLRDPSRRFDPQALLCTDPAQEPLQILRWFTQRWQLEVTFREARDHLGVETQRQWSDQAIARTTPCLLGLFSVVTLLANRLSRHARLRVSAAAWYRKQRPTFADTLAAVRRQLWREQGFLTSRRAGKPGQIRPALRDGIVHALCYAA